MAQHLAVAQSADTEIEANVVRVPEGTDLVEWYFEQGWTDGLPVVPPTRARVDAVVDALGGDPDFVECKVPPRHGSLSREVLAINMVMAGCKPEYAPGAAMLALTADAFNLNGVQATTHMAAPLLIVNGPIARERRLQCVRLVNRQTMVVSHRGDVTESVKVASPQRGSRRHRE